MAAEGKAFIFYCCNLVIIDFVSIDERPAVESQSNLASGSEMVSIYNAAQKFREEGSLKIWRAKNIKFWTTFSATSALDTAYLQNGTSHWQTKMLLSVYNVSPKS